MGGGHGHAHASTGNLRTAFLLNLGFTVIEVIGGLWTIVSSNQHFTPKTPGIGLTDLQLRQVLA